MKTLNVDSMCSICSGMTTLQFKKLHSCVIMFAGDQSGRVGPRPAGLIRKQKGGRYCGQDMVRTPPSSSSSDNTADFALRDKLFTHHEKHPEIWREAKFLLYANRGTISYANWGWLWQFEHLTVNLDSLKLTSCVNQPPHESFGQQLLPETLR